MEKPITTAVATVLLPTASTDTLLDKPHALGYGKSAFGTGFTELLAMSATCTLLVPPESCFSFFTAFKRRDRADTAS